MEKGRGPETPWSHYYWMIRGVRYSDYEEGVPQIKCDPHQISTRPRPGNWGQNGLIFSLGDSLIYWKGPVSFFLDLVVCEENTHRTDPPSYSRGRETQSDDSRWPNKRTEVFLPYMESTRRLSLLLKRIKILDGFVLKSQRKLLHPISRLHSWVFPYIMWFILIRGDSRSSIYILY